MASTTTVANTLQLELNKANPNTLADVLRQMQLGTMLAPTKAALTNNPAANTVALNPPALIVGACLVTGVGTAATGPRAVTSAAGTAVAPTMAGQPGVALLSDDGTTLTFEGTVSAVTVEYIPRSAVDLATTSFPDR